MIQFCQKCGKEYEPKRRGGKFCSTSCRVVKHQLIKRGKAWTNPTTTDEQYLAEKLVAVGRSAQEMLTFVEGLSAEIAIEPMHQLVEGWARVANNSIIERIQYHQQELKAQAARTKRGRSSRSVSTERKPEALA